jgi:phosphomannomutase
MCTSSVKDKDGITALAIFSEIAATAYRSGGTVMDELEKLYRKYERMGFIIIL